MRFTKGAALALAAFALLLALLALTQAASAATNFAGGTLGSNQTWDALGSPYSISASLAIPAGLKLQITAGTTVEFAESATLVVAGQLDAVGSAGQPLAFRPVSTAAWWGGIQTSGAGRVRVENATLTAVDEGFHHISSGALDVANVRIDAYARESLFIDFATGPSNITNLTTSGGSWGVHVAGSTGSVRAQGLRVSATGVCLQIEQGSNLSLSNVNATGCTSTGFQIDRSDNVTAANVSVRSSLAAVNVSNSTRVTLSLLDLATVQFCLHLRDGMGTFVSGLRVADCAMAVVTEGNERNLTVERLNITSGAAVLFYGGTNLTLRDSTIAGAGADAVSNRWVIPPPPPQPPPPPPAPPPPPPAPATITFGTASQVTLSNVTADQRQWTLQFGGTSGLTLRKVSIPRASNVAVWLQNVDNVLINQSRILGTIQAIYAEGASRLTVEDSTIISTIGTGILCTPCTDSTIRANVFSNNNLGLRMTGGSGSIITRNLFLFNTVHASTNSALNQWDDGAIGNLWDDYTGIDANLDGIGDTPYTVQAGFAQDRYPIMRYPDFQLPTADAGPDFVVYEDNQVWFNGWRCTDNVGIRLYIWSTSAPNQSFAVEGYDAMMIFDTPGEYEVTLTVIDFGGNRAQDTVMVFVLDRTRPVASSGGNRTVDEDVIVVFDGGGSTDNDPSFPYSASFDWTVDDAAGPRTAHGLRAPYTFATPGNFTVTLVVRDSAGLSDLQRFWVVVRDRTPPALGTLVAPEGEEDRPFRAYAAPSTDNDPLWPLGKGEWFELWQNGSIIDNTTSSPAVFNVSEPGVYTYWYFVHDRAGNLASDDIVFIVGDATPPDLSSLRNRTAELARPIAFDLMGVTDNDPTFPATAQARWEFPVPAGRVVLLGAAATFTFTLEGRYEVWAQVADRAGNTARRSFFVTVEDTESPELAAFGPATVEAGADARFWAEYDDPSGVVQPTWRVDGLSDGRYGAALTYRFPAPGNYTVRVQVKDPLGHGANASLNVRVTDGTNPRSSVACGPGGSCDGLRLFVGESFTAAFTGGDAVAGIEVTFDWGDGASAAARIAAHSYAQAGNYTVSVRTVDGAGNAQSLSFTVAVETKPGPTVPPPTGNVTNTQTTGTEFPTIAALGLTAIVAAVGVFVGMRVAKHRRAPPPHKT